MPQKYTLEYLKNNKVAVNFDNWEDAEKLKIIFGCDRDSLLPMSSGVFYFEENNWFYGRGLPTDYKIICASDLLKDWDVTDTNVGEIDNAHTIAAIRTHLTEIDNLLKKIQ